MWHHSAPYAARTAEEKAGDFAMDSKSYWHEYRISFKTSAIDAVVPYPTCAPYGTDIVNLVRGTDFPAGNGILPAAYGHFGIRRVML